MAHGGSNTDCPTLRAVDPPGSPRRRWRCDRCGKVAPFGVLERAPCLQASETPTVVTDPKKIN